MTSFRALVCEHGAGPVVTGDASVSASDTMGVSQWALAFGPGEGMIR